MINRTGRNWLAWVFTLVACATAESAEFDPAHTESWQVPNPDLYGVSTRGDLVYAVGYWGAALRSTDRGNTWSRHPTPTDRTLYAVSFATETHGWAVGDDGTLLQSVDGGLSWRGLSVELAADEFGDVRRLDTPLFDVSAVSAHEAWAVGDFGVVIHTMDGAAWRQLQIPAESFSDQNIPDRILNGVHFANRENGWIVGEFGTTLRTADAGETWIGERAFDGVVEDVYLMDAAAGTDGVAVAVGTGGVVIRTTDRGATWSSSEIGTTAGIFGAARRDERAIIVGDRGIVFVSSDRGTTWVDPARPRLYNWLRSAALGRDGLAFAVGQGGVVLRSTDGGQSWTQVGGRRPIARKPVPPGAVGSETDSAPSRPEAP